LYGDIFYDYAKIYQSLIGYDEVLHNVIVEEVYKKEMIVFYEKYIVDKFGEERLEWIKVITSSLLFTLLPLHEDENKNKKYFELIKRILVY
jgi:hypothetical protein